MIRRHDQWKPTVVVVQPLVISLLLDDSSGFVEIGTGNEGSGEPEPTFSWTVLETREIVILTVDLARRHNVELIHLHSLFERRMIRREHQLKSATPRITVTFVVDFLRHALTANMFDIIQQPIAECRIGLNLLP
jgi:hypothetical protein